MSTPVLRIALVALAALAALAPFGARAQEAQLPDFYVEGTVGRAEYDNDCWFFGDCESGRATALRLGGGARFGATAFEAWWMDFGRASLTNPPSSVRISGPALGFAWTARAGEPLELTWRVGVADLRHSGANQGVHRSFRPYGGMAGAIRLAPALSLVISGDITNAAGADGVTTDVTVISLGLRVRF